MVIIISCVVIVLSVLAVVLAIHFTNTQQVKEEKAADATNIAGFVASYKPTKTYSTLPAAEQEKFMENKAAYYGLAPGEEATPAALTEACLDRRERELSGIVANNPEDIEQNRALYNEAAKKTREYCYKTYAENGTIPQEDIPRNMAH